MRKREPARSVPVKFPRTESDHQSIKSAEAKRLRKNAKRLRDAEHQNRRGKL